MAVGVVFATLAFVSVRRGLAVGVLVTVALFVLFLALVVGGDATEQAIGGG